MRRPRHLSAEERALWDLVTRRDKPARPAQDIRSPVDMAPPKPAVDVVPRDPLRPFQIGQMVNHTSRNDLLPGLTERLARAPVQMDSKAFVKLKRGKLVPEGRIDLHGMTLAQAHPTLIGFILSAHAAGKRLVLVITGKGKLRDDFAPMPARQGILRHQVPQWLAMAPMGPLVMQIAPAHISHGGEGAYYVYLRRSR
jgi:DNA-nicking Smr family endonuclease